MADKLRLFTPLTLGPLTLRNRAVRAAAFEGMSPDGAPSQMLIDHHREVAAGGISMTTVAYAAVVNHGRTFSHQLWMREDIVPGLRQLTDAVHAEGAAASIQLGHGGNMADRAVTGQRAWAPSAVFSLFGLTRPKAMTTEDIQTLIDAFVDSTRLAREAGFDAVEVQGGHGYLLSQFLSPPTNRRKDPFGGSLENRARLLRRVVRAVRAEAGQDLAVLVKINLRDGYAGGMDLDESMEVAGMLEAEGADALVTSGGFVTRCPMYLMRGDVPVKEIAADQPGLGRKVGLLMFGKMVVKAYPFTEAFFLEDALKLRQAVKMPLLLVGGMRSLEVIEDVLAQGIDGVAMARPTFRDPNFIRRLESGEETKSRCEPCNLCMATMYHGAAVCPEREPS